ncbi:MAG TPA: aminoglycoside phosphotransferase [Pseudonocardia sp.]|nr:aminoglycoside phosphotransferase [Pseudonocardia sp.]
MTELDELTRQLPDWLAAQRWFAAKGRPVRAVEVAHRTPLPVGDDLRLDLLILTVTFDDDGPAQLYQLLLGRRSRLRDELHHVEIGVVGGLIAYDGLWDAEATAWLLAAIRGGRTVDDVRFVPEPGAEIATGPAGRVLGVEQSNTSVAYGERSILKLFRQVQRGVNPDLELHRALRSVGSAQVAALQGAVEGTLDGGLVTLAMLQDYAANSADGWSMALASVRDLLAEADLRADEVGGDFAGEATRLGETVGVVHDELRRALGVNERDAGEVAAAMLARLDAVLAGTPELAEHAEAIREVYAGLAGTGLRVPAQRVHGDLHLGQTLRTPYGWLVIDFEGEPATPLELRVRPDSPLRDVAGMLRSFDYAAYHQLALQDPAAEADDPEHHQLAWRANEWAERNRAAFCDGYTLRSGADPREHRVLLRAFELDKAVYEVQYETRNRPSWAQIPLGSIVRLTAAGRAHR